jgi:intein/homing endonuclease
MKKKMNVEIAEILGAFIGDGWIESSLNSIYITGDKIEDKDYYDNFLAPIFSKNFVDIKPKEYKYWKVYGIGCHRKNVIEQCIEFGFKPGAKALTVEIPKEILKVSNRNIIKAVIRGIFDADGSFWCEKSRAKTSKKWKRTYHYHPEFQIGSCSKKLLEQIKELLDKFGIESKISIRAKKGFKNNRNINDHYGLRIRKQEQINKWFKIIGSNNPRHQTRYTVWKNYGFLPPRTNINQRKDILASKLDPKSFY